MKNTIDKSIVKTWASRAHAASLGGLLIMLGSIAYSLWKPEQSVISSFPMFAGFILAGIGIYLANRWVKRPRPEEVLEKALKSLNDQFYLYHYLKFCDHVLLTPFGVVVIETINLDGEFTYQEGRWRQRFSISRALRLPFEVWLGNPIARAQKTAQEMKTRLQKVFPEGLNIRVFAMVVFVNPAASFRTDGTPIPVCSPQKIQKHLQTKNDNLPRDTYLRVREILDKAFEKKSYDF